MARFGRNAFQGLKAKRNNIMTDQKFQLRYSASEDRVLIISGSDAANRRSFSLTRRMVRQLWPSLNQVMSVVAPLATQNKATAKTEPPPPHRKARPADPVPGQPGDADLPSPPADTHKTTASDDPFDALPPPETSHLVRKLQLVDRGAKPRLLVLTANDAVLRVPLENAQLAQIYEALRTLIQRAEWEIELDEGLPDPATEPSAQREADIDITTESPSRYRH